MHESHVRIDELRSGDIVRTSSDRYVVLSVATAWPTLDDPTLRVRLRRERVGSGGTLWHTELLSLPEFLVARVAE
jgi:hypothetical protein